MTVIYSEDGQSVTRQYVQNPIGHWVASTGHKGYFVTADIASGYFHLVETPEPVGNNTKKYNYSIVREGDMFVEKWTERPLTEAEQAELLETEAPDLASVIAAKLVTSENASPQPWVQPTGAHDAYLPGAIVLNGVDGDRYRNKLTIPNVWGLNVHGWENLDVVLPTDPQPWVQPTGAHDAYNIGDQVTFEGNTYESLIDGNTWSPTSYPAGWNQI
jgi:hypothetical protein